MIFDSFNYLLFVMTAWLGFFFVPKKIRRPSLLFFSLAFSYIIDVKYFAAVLTCLFFDISTFWAISKLSNIFFRLLFLLPNLIIFIYFQLDLPFPNLSEYQSAFHSNEIKILVPWGIAIFLIQKLAFLIRKHEKYNLLDYLVFQNLFFKTFSGPLIDMKMRYLNIRQVIFLYKKFLLA